VFTPTPPGYVYLCIREKQDAFSNHAGQIMYRERSQRALGRAWLQGPRADLRWQVRVAAELSAVRRSMRSCTSRGRTALDPRMHRSRSTVAASVNQTKSHKLKLK